jgi:hypothetical protein
MRGDKNSLNGYSMVDRADHFLVLPLVGREILWVRSTFLARWLTSGFALTVTIVSTVLLLTINDEPVELALEYQHQRD